MRFALLGLLVLPVVVVADTDPFGSKTVALNTDPFAAPARPVATPPADPEERDLTGLEARRYVERVTGDRTPPPMIVPRDDGPQASAHPLTAMLVGQSCSAGSCAVSPSASTSAASGSAQSGGRFTGRLRDGDGPVRRFFRGLRGRFGGCG